MTNTLITDVEMVDVDLLPSTASLLAKSGNTNLGASAILVTAVKDFSDFCLISVLGLAQRLNIDILPITWQDSSFPLGQGRAKINQRRINSRASFAFKRFQHTGLNDPFRETVQEIVILSHPLIECHPHIVKLIGICWEIPDVDHAWPVLVFEKSQHGDLYQFIRLGKGRSLSIQERLRLCVNVGVAIRDMHLNSILVL